MAIFCFPYALGLAPSTSKILVLLLPTWGLGEQDRLSAVSSQSFTDHVGLHDPEVQMACFIYSQHSYRWWQT